RRHQASPHGPKPRGCPGCARRGRLHPRSRRQERHSQVRYRRSPEVPSHRERDQALRVIRLFRPWVAAVCVLCAGAQAASADGLRWSPPSYSQKVETSPGESNSNTAGWLLFAGGVALDVGSFVLAGKADDYYRQYQAGTDPIELSHQYDMAVRYDRLASAS